MKKVLCLFLQAMTATSLMAQADATDSIATTTRPLIVDKMENATIHQSAEIRQLLDEKVNGKHNEVVEIDGYRLQIYSSNRQQQAKQEAEQLKKTIEAEISEPVYILSDQPFWKVRIGNFRTITEAGAYKTELISRFPHLQAATYVVRDKIQVKQ